MREAFCIGDDDEGDGDDRALGTKGAAKGLGRKFKEVPEPSVCLGGDIAVAVVVEFILFEPGVVSITDSPKEIEADP